MENMYLVCLIIVFIVAIVETILSSTWNKHYFSHGIEIFKKSIPVSNLDNASHKISEFVNNLDKQKGFSNYKGADLDDNVFAFQKKLITIGTSRNGLESIHGTISIDSETRAIRIKGFVGYSFLSLMIYIFIFFLLDSDLVSALIIVSILSLLSYWFESRRYKKLTTEITNLINS
ncbi:MAG: hypothetical protein IJA53_12755 [Spirochaetaceae bacterium]|nr:hypothetical protein [Spirochaetaceae bacterium]